MSPDPKWEFPSYWPPEVPVNHDDDEEEEENEDEDD